MRLLLITSSASAGRGISAPVTGSKPLPSLTTRTFSPATFTASSAIAWMKAAVLSSAVGDGLVQGFDARVGLAGCDGARFVCGQRVGVA